jgi:hypothetical protein
LPAGIEEVVSMMHVRVCTSMYGKTGKAGGMHGELHVCTVSYPLGMSIICMSYLVGTLRNPSY